MSPLRGRDVLVATLAGLGVVTVVDALAVPFLALAVHAGAYGVNALVSSLVGIVAAGAGAATAVVVHELRLAPGAGSGPAQWLLVGLPTVLVLAVVAVVGTLAWGPLGSFGRGSFTAPAAEWLGAVLPVLGTQVVAVLVGAGAALGAGALCRSRSAARTAPGPSVAPH
ncbi:hypothetical protein GXB85_01355 [Cellulomonas sp. APG4]|uniref:hypothetical protein n=1 Tax=Cellulomonas sp. APG4 TaxID=1538656 RepID=UPI00137AE26C|nr:hypothetical protein [Cellulomonas sp. APG4]NCT89605.1 hypothetical protein [Cellulomonas sp. APG4]